MIHLEEFSIVLPPATRKKSLALSVMLDGTIRINGKLLQEMSAQYLFIRRHTDGKTILLQKTDQEEQAYMLPKTGTVKSDILQEELQQCNIPIPARYIVQWDDSINMWVGEYDPSHKFQNQSLFGKKTTFPRTPKKRRKKDLNDMLPEA